MARRAHSCGGDCIQIPWIREPMRRLYPRHYSFHFRNLIYANRRNSTYLCFRVERMQHPLSVSFDYGVFRNQFCENRSYHAELCFLSWFHAKKLSPCEYYHVTLFVSWSPCITCAKEMANFLKKHRNVTLSIFTSRLYYFWYPEFHWGLQELCRLGAQVEVMSFQDFNYCWENFVYNRRMRFRCWKNVHKNYTLLSGWLNDILGR